MIGVDFANGIVLLGVPAVLLVPLVVEGLKRLGMPVAWATPAAVVVGGLVALLAETLRIWPETEPVVRVVLAAVVLGFGASGVYSQAHGRRSTPPGPSTPADPAGTGGQEPI